MALVDDDQIEEVGVVFSVQRLVAADREILVEREVQLAPVARLAFELVDGTFAERGLELPGDWLIDEDVPVREIEHSRVARAAPLRFPQLPDDLHGDEGL